MTAMPQLVSLFNAVGGGAAALIAIDDYLRLLDAGSVRIDTHIFIVLDIIIGSITFTGSLIASGKLQGLIPGKPILIPGGRLVTLALAAVTVIAAAILFITGTPSLPLFLLILAAALVFGVTIHGHGRRDGRLRDREPGLDHRRRARRRLGRDPHQADGRRHEPLGHQHHDRRVRGR
jgi:NAD/NADP transhydrogenase beta subunit